VEENSKAKMSAQSKLPLGEISGYDQHQLKKTQISDKSGVSSQDKILATIAKGNVNLKHAAEPTVKTWMPTKEEIEEEKKQMA